MTDNGTQAAPGLPMVVEAPPARPRFARVVASADFLSQLIAARQHLPPQRERRRGQPAQAVAAYSAGARIAVRRMPAGYRRSLLT